MEVVFDDMEVLVELVFNSMFFVDDVALFVMLLGCFTRSSGGGTGVCSGVNCVETNPFFLLLVSYW